MNTMHRKYGPEGLEIIAVNLDKERALADGFLAEVPAEFSLRFDPAGGLAKEFGVQAMPSSYLLAADGTVLRATSASRRPTPPSTSSHSRCARGSNANKSLIKRK